MWIDELVQKKTAKTQRRKEEQIHGISLASLRLSGKYI